MKTIDIVWKPITGFLDTAPSRWEALGHCATIQRVYWGDKAQYFWTARKGKHYGSDYCDDLPTAQAQAQTFLALATAVRESEENVTFPRTLRKG